MNNKKILLANILSFIGLSSLLLKLRGLFYRGDYIYVINYHNTPLDESDNFEKQLSFYSENFTNVTLCDFKLFFKNKKWHKHKPGLIISFDDGLRNNFDVALPLLEKYGFTGWFFIPTDFIDCPPDKQISFAKEHSIYSKTQYKDTRISMSWKEVENLDKQHVIGCHTKTHHRLTSSTSKEQMVDEIITSKLILEDKLKHSVDIFCWVGGEEFSYSAEASQCIRDASYKYSFMTNCSPITVNTNKLQLQRNNVETDTPMNVVKFIVSGIMDWLYFFKRNRVNKLTSDKNN